MRHCLPKKHKHRALLFEWIEYKDKKYFMRTLRNLHKNRLLELDEKSGAVQIFPPGSAAVQDLIRQLEVSGLP
jgi:hypothetical protein